MLIALLSTKFQRSKEKERAPPNPTLSFFDPLFTSGFKYKLLLRIDIHT